MTSKLHYKIYNISLRIASARGSYYFGWTRSRARLRLPNVEQYKVYDKQGGQWVIYVYAEHKRSALGLFMFVSIKLEWMKAIEELRKILDIKVSWLVLATKEGASREMGVNFY